MIKSFVCGDTAELHRREDSRKFKRVANVALRKLRQLHAARELRDLAFPGNHLEKLSGDRRGQYSIRVNDQWRLCFSWNDGNAYDVEIVDYHH